MEFGVSTHLIKELPIADALTFIARTGFRAAEVWMSDLARTGETPAQIALRAERHHLRLSVHATALEMDHATSEITEASLQRIKTAFEIGAQVGAGTVVIHPPRRCRPGCAPSRYWSMLEVVLGRLSRSAQSEGVWMALEGMDGDKPAEAIKTPTDIRQVMSFGIPRLGICLDMAHIQAVMHPVDYLDQIDPAWLRHVHLSDRSRQGHHLPLGEGDMPIARILERLARCYGGPVIIEGRKKRRGKHVVSGNYRYLQRLGLLAARPIDS